MIPNINRKGKILVNSNNKISLSSNGSGGFLANLNKTRIFESWESADIRYLNITDLNNLNSNVADPISLGFMIKSGLKCVAEATKRKNKHVENPCFMQSNKDTISFHYPFEVINFTREGDFDLPLYECPHLNMFTTVGFLGDVLKNRTAELFKYRIKEKMVPHIENSSLVFSKYQWLPPCFTFEINAFNLMDLTVKSCLLVRDSMDCVILKVGESMGEGPFGEAEALKKLKELAEENFRTKLDLDPGK